MLGIIYLLLCFGVGWAICTYAFPGIYNFTCRTYDNKNIYLSPYLLLLPAWFVSGVLSITWLVYLIGFLARNTASPLTIANAIILPMALLFWGITFYIKRIKNNTLDDEKLLVCKDSKTRIKEGLLLGGIILLGAILMWSTFYVKDESLYIGVTVFSDFSPHIGMIRSFSYGNNFPTSYSHFAGEDIKYHFMFQFMVGNLEFLGLRIDYAFNIPSIISFVSAFSLIYVLALKITGRILSGVLSCVFFAFRSSKAFFTYISKLPKGVNIWKALWENTEFIGDTPHEDWGLWNLNVYCNQRHLAFGISVMFFVLILFIPHLYRMFETIKEDKFSFKKIFFSRESWEIKSIRYPIALGLLLGSLSFFHGSAVIGCLLVLFVIAIFSKHRLEFLITALITLILSILQSRSFISGQAVSPKFLFGFIAENKTIFGSIDYLDRLLGILPLVIIAAFIIGKWIDRYLILAFLAPLIFAFTVSLTVDVTVNHKFIMISCILLGIFGAYLVNRMCEKKELVYTIAAGIIIIMMTITGIYDFTTVLKKNSRMGKIVLNMKDPLTQFVRDNSDSKDIFLTAPYTINQLVFGGAMLYQGHQYYAWSAGYDTDYRDLIVKKIYEAKTPKELDTLVKENNIRYIVVDYDNRISSEYNLNEENIRATYKCVYESGYDEWKMSIFDTKVLETDIQ
ncbi:hypothetical protein [Herbinix luporum]|jgi:hypothetical protein|uniref:hypothetical protein n=1 Tax=Herbinix luporum TaxID=1679721 RepID=UPI001761DB67|nr:hypothetical protein [Herbinix luporum]HHT57942.1 hypothetical protein [Herbinix luporum]